MVRGIISQKVRIDVKGSIISDCDSEGRKRHSPDHSSAPPSAIGTDKEKNGCAAAESLPRTADLELGTDKEDEEKESFMSAIGLWKIDQKELGGTCIYSRT